MDAVNIINNCLPLWTRAIDECLKGVDISLKCLAKQSVINKRQKRTNRRLAIFALAGIAYAVTSEIKRREQEEEIETLKKEIEELKSTKGE